MSVPLTVLPVYSVPEIVPLRVYVTFAPCVLTSIHVIGPVKAPLKMAPLGTPWLPFPVTTSVEPTLENVPPAEMLPLIKAPVEKVTEPRECPLVATIPLKLISSDCVEVMPAFEIAMLPNRLVRLIPSAKAAWGKASTSTMRINAAFICKSPGFKLSRNFTRTARF